MPSLHVSVAGPGGEAPAAYRLLTYLGARADIARGVNDGRFNTSRPRWTLMRDCIPQPGETCSSAEGYRELVGRWLRTFGPGTEDDVVWWLGATKGIVRAALDSNGNAGTTAWADGRIVGCWTQDGQGAVRLHFAQRVTRRARRALESEAARLTTWLGGVRINTGYASPAMKAATANLVADRGSG